MVRKVISRCAIVLAAWLPFFVLWVLFGLSFALDPSRTVFVASLITMGTAGLLGIAVWYSCRRWPWPLGFNLKFYSLHVVFAVLYAAAWTVAVFAIDSLCRGGPVPAFWSGPIL